jgi:hypothetical protein
MDAMRGYGEDMNGGGTSTRPVEGIFARFAKNRVTRLPGIEDEGSRSITKLVYLLVILFHLLVNVICNMYLFFIL